MPYLTGDRHQTLLLPSSIDEYIGNDDPVRVYDAFVEQVDMTALGIEENVHRTGRPEFDPRAMLKLLVYGYSYGIRSSRKLERATYHNMSFIWLTGGLKPDHKTIARFRRHYAHALKDILKQCARVCLKLGLIEGNTLFVDGTKIRANASMKHTWTVERCRKTMDQIDEQIESLLRECEAVDETEAYDASLVKLQSQLADQQTRKEKIQGILTDLAASERTALNTVDTEAARVRQGGHIEAGYNCQAVVDDKHGFIVHSEVVSQSNDNNLFSSQIRAAQQTLQKTARHACADKGFASPEDLQKMLENGVDVVVPMLRHSNFRDHFVYDAPRDAYRCPQGHTLKYVGDHKNNKSRMYRIQDPQTCQRCQRFGDCTKSAQGRRVERPFTEAVRERLEKRYREADAQYLARRRKFRAEPPFGHIKHNLGMRYFLLRGLAGVRAEAGLAATCFNLTRAMKVMGISGLLEKLSARTLAMP